MNRHIPAPSIDVRSLSSGQHRFEWAPDARTLELDPELFHGIRVEAKANIGREVLVDVRVKALARLTCSRTLVDFEQELTGEMRLLAVEEMVEEDGDPSAEVALSEQPDIVGMEDGVVELATPIRDIILLAVPLKPVAPEAVDVEIQTSFGETEDTDNDVDPRWTALRSLRTAPDETGGDASDAKSQSGRNTG